jgi:hypothetical protein
MIPARADVPREACTFQQRLIMIAICNVGIISATTLNTACNWVGITATTANGSMGEYLWL